MADLTFREQAAIAAMQAMVSRWPLRDSQYRTYEDTAECSFKYADAMVTAMGEPAKADYPEAARPVHDVQQPTPDPRDAELSKLRAVAEASARLQRLRDSSRPDGIGEASLQLDGALWNWCPGWRTKEGGR